MEHRQLGQSDLQVPVIIFGAWAIGGWLWGGADENDAVEAILRSIDLGAAAIDTAPIYGFGRSEEIVGRAIKGRRDSVVVATKCGMRWDLEEGESFFDGEDLDGTKYKIYRNLRPQSIREECERSLRRLGIDVIDVYQCHWPDKTTPLEDTMGALLKLKDEGKIRAIGVSNFTAEMMATCLKYGPVDSDQPKYNILQRDIEANVLPFCRKHNIGVLAYSPIAQGLLTGKVTMDREFPKTDIRSKQPWFRPENRRKAIDALEKVRPIAEAHSVTLSQLAINWVISEPGVTSAIVGARDAKQVEENIGGVDFTLDEEERRMMRETFEALGKAE